MGEVTLEMLGQMVQSSQDMLRGVAADVHELKGRITDVDRQLGRNTTAESEHYASVMVRMDRMEDRIDRVERRLTIGGG